MTETEKFKELFKTNITRDGADKLLKVLEHSDFFTAPASTRYHDSNEGGLCHHSLRVFEELYDEVYNELSVDRHCTDKYSIETISIVSLLHDVCKIGFYNVSSRNVKDEKGKWIQVPYYEVDDLFPYGHGEKSVYMINDIMKLTDEEAMAIRWHMGGFTEGQDMRNSSGKAFSMFPLGLYLHIADMKASYLG